jgi:hypothetical protein
VDCYLGSLVELGNLKSRGLLVSNHDNAADKGSGSGMVFWRHHDGIGLQINADILESLDWLRGIEKDKSSSGFEDSQ